MIMTRAMCAMMLLISNCHYYKKYSLTEKIDAPL